MRTELHEKHWEVRLKFDVDTDDEARYALEALCEGTVRTNMVWINSAVWNTGEYPPCCLEDAGVRYLLPIGCDGVNAPCQTIRGAAEMLDTGEGTCIDIACYMAAQLRLRHRPALVYLENMLTNGVPTPGEYHVILRTANGRMDYTQDLIDGNVSACSIDCGNTTFRAIDPAHFDPAKQLPR